MRLLRLLALAGIAVVAILLAAVAVNLVDEDLLPEAAAFFESGKTPELTVASGYALLSGFPAPAGEDPRAWAVARSRAETAAWRAKRRFLEPPDQLGVAGAAEMMCRPEQFDCVERYRANPKSVADLALDNAVLLGRYRELLGLRDLGDAGILPTLDSRIPGLGRVVETQSVLLSQIAVQAAAGDFDGALARLEADAALHRRWLSQGRLLISKMIALRALSRDLLLATQVARRIPDPTPAQWGALERIAAPLAPVEWALEQSLLFEAAIYPDAIDLVRRDPQAFGELVEMPPFTVRVFALGLRRNATLNGAYRRFSLWREIDRTPTHELDSRLEQVREVARKSGKPDWTWLYNPSGKAYNADALIIYDEYVYRLRDLDGLARLACAAFAVRRDRIPVEGVEAYLAKAGGRCANPYTNKPMTWDAATGTLGFEPRDARSVERFGGTGKRVALAPR